MSVTVDVVDLYPNDLVIEVVQVTTMPIVNIPAGFAGPKGDPGWTIATFQWTGVLQIVVGDAPFVVPYNMTIAKVAVAVSPLGPPTGNDVVADLNVNGVTMFTTQANRPRILAGTSGPVFAVPDVVNLLLGDVLTVDLDEVGTIYAGRNFVLEITT